MDKKTTTRRVKKKQYRSNWENTIANELIKNKVKILYEEDKLVYTIPTSEHIYTPDFKLSNSAYIEAKGIFDRKDREKILLIKEQHPRIRIYLAFQNARQKISKRSKTTYGDWCTKHGIEWSHGGIKKEWLE